jgi:hypothetical protein
MSTGVMMFALVWRVPQGFAGGLRPTWQFVVTRLLAQPFHDIRLRFAFG